MYTKYTLGETVSQEDYSWGMPNRRADHASKAKRVATLRERAAYTRPSLHSAIALVCNLHTGPRERPTCKGDEIKNNSREPPRTIKET